MNIRYFIYLMSVFMLSLTSAFAQQTTSGYNVSLDPGIQVIDNSDGSSSIQGRFKLYNGQAPSNTLTGSGFRTCIDDNTVPSTIIDPGTVTRKMADVVFCMDVSGSMGNEIQAVKNNTNAFVQKLISNNYDVRLGLITFGGYPAPYLRKRNNGLFYKNEQDFISEFNGLKANGGHEEWFDCLAYASQYPFRSGADRVAILVTDENGNSSKYSLGTALPVVNNNATKVYGVSYNNLGNVQQVVHKTNGELFHITDPFDLILDKIANSIVNTYTVSTHAMLSVGQHDLCVEPISNPIGRDDKTFKVGANPVVALIPATQQLVQGGVTPGTANFSIEASAIDQDGTVSAVNIIWDDKNNSSTNTMTAGSNNTYAFAYSDTANSLQNIGDCFNFSIQAIDNEGRNTTVPANLGNTMGGQWHVCVTNNAPTVSDLTPSTYEYQKSIEVTAKIADDQDVSNIVATLKYREPGRLVWNTVAMSLINADTVSGLIPDTAAGFNDLEVEVVAQDTYQAIGMLSQKLTVQSVPVSIIDVTRYADTLDVGPFSVHAVVAGIDVTQQGKVELTYTVNAGSASALPMTQSVTGTHSPLATNSNIYVSQIPKVDLGDLVCYSVLASNPTDSATSTETCFEILQPAEPLVLTPASAIVAVGDGAIEFIGKGGYPTYEWSALNGDVSTTLADKIQYIPKLTGLDKLTAKDQKGFTVTAIIRVLPQLAIDPPVQGKSFAPGNIVGLTAVGGEPAYQWVIEGATGQASGSDNEAYTITLGNDPATVKVTLLDSAGRSTQVQFDNQGLLRIAPTEATMALESKKSFTASGGVPPYAWTTIGGDVNDPSATTIEYESPSIAGMYHVMVTDSTGNFANVSIKVGDPFRVTPHCARIQRGDVAKFDVVSGIAPYRWETNYGTLSSTSAASITFTPEANLGLYEISAYDATGSMRNLCVEVSDSLLLSRNNITIAKGESVQGLSVSGGTAPYTWSADRGVVNPNNGDTITYTAPAVIGDSIDTIKVYDSTGQEAIIQVQVVENISTYGNLICSPGKVVLRPDAPQQFTCNTSNTLSWSATQGDVNTTGKYIAPQSFGEFTVTAADDAGRTATMTVQSISVLSVTPSQPTVVISENTNLTAVGGEAPYIWRAERGVLSATTGESITYTAPVLVGDGQDNVVVTDNGGREAKAVVNVIGGIVDELICAPAQVTMTKQKTQQFSCNEANNNLVWSSSAGDIDTNGLFTAPDSAGAIIVTATNITKGLTADMQVQVASQLTLTPTTAFLKLGETANFAVEGGTAPYTWKVEGNGDLDTITGTSNVFTPETAGTVDVFVMDNTGLSMTATIEVYGDLAITPAAVTVLPNGGASFKANGGTGSITWVATKGSIDNAGNYSAPTDTGTYDITATDGAGAQATASIRVANVPVASPQKVWLDRGEQTTLNVVGGSQPYTWTTTTGQLQNVARRATATGNSVIFTAPNVSSDVTITVTDNVGESFKITAYVDLELTSTREELFLTPGATAKVAATGGIPPFEWKTLRGEFSSVTTDEAAENVYTAPNVTGEDTITIRDRKNNTVQVAVKSAMPLTRTPSMRFMSTTETGTFQLNGGFPPYTCTVEGEGEIAPAISQDGLITFTAGGSMDQDITVKCSDTAGSNVEAQVFVDRVLGVSPSEAFLVRGQDMKFKATGGTGNYIASATSGTADVNADYGKGTYTAPNRLGSYTVTVEDSSGQMANINVTVEDSSPVISPSIAVMAPGETRTFLVNRGAPSYTWSFDGGIPDVKRGNNADVVEVTAPALAGTYTLDAQDVTGMSATANIEVVQPLILSPSTFTVYKGEQSNVRIVAKGAVGGCDWTLNNLQPLREEADYIIVKPRTDVEKGSKYTVTCRDQAGSIKRSNIIVSLLPGDLNGDGMIDDNEAQNVLDAFFQDNPDEQIVNGIPMKDKRELVYIHLELMVNVQ